MSTPQEIRRLRMGNDYKSMVNIRGDIISWQPIRGVEPYIEAYKLRVMVRSIIGPGPSYRDMHELIVELPAGYPKDPPLVKMISVPVVFHPNWFKDARWCKGTWSPRESLGQHVVRMIRTLQFDPAITAPNDAANRDARDWYMQNLYRNIFPCDKKVLPDPTKDKFQQKTFVIH